MAGGRCEFSNHFLDLLSFFGCSDRVRPLALPAGGVHSLLELVAFSFRRFALLLLCALEFPLLPLCSLESFIEVLVLVV